MWVREADMAATGIFLPTMERAKRHLKVPRKHFRHRCVVELEQNLSFLLGACFISKGGRMTIYILSFSLVQFQMAKLSAP